MNPTTAFGRTAASSAWLLAWGLALYGVLQVARLDVPLQHGICGPWGCGPTLQALAACHLFWIVLLLPAALLATVRLNDSLVDKMSWTLACAGAAGIAAIVLYEYITWLPLAVDWQRRYFIHRCFFAVTILVEVPLAESLVIGIAMRTFSFRRAARDSSSDR
ncbi:MAG TPA: hypothetical protein VGM05_03775 [Planctomycetaceae bacterium]|jgi:hypothetical protein